MRQVDPKKSKLAHLFLREYSYKGLKLAVTISPPAGIDTILVTIILTTVRPHVNMIVLLLVLVCDHRGPRGRAGPALHA